MKDKDWRTLIYSISQGKCILVLGPEIPIPTTEPAALPGHTPLPEKFRPKSSMTLPERLANRLCTELQVTNLDPQNLIQAAEFYATQFGRNDLEMETLAFYKQAPRSTAHDLLAGIPFNLVISLTHDAGLVDAMREKGRSPVVEAYNFQGDQKTTIGLGIDGVGSPLKPLIYHLYGHVDVPSSLVMTENDILDFLTSVISKNPDLPSDLRSQLSDNNKSFLLLGFGLTRWYLRILLHILKVNKRGTRSFALERLESPDDLLASTILYLRKGLKVESFDFAIDSFVSELSRRTQEEGLSWQPDSQVVHNISAGRSRGLPGPTELSQAPKVFISYASEDEAHARKIFETLKAAHMNPWFDKAQLRGGAMWDGAIEDALDEVDYVIVVQSRALYDKTFSYVNKEIMIALERQQMARRGISYLIPVQVDDGPPLEDLRHLQTLDLRPPGAYDELASLLARDQQRRQRRAS